jgi:hypothetical protein
MKAIIRAVISRETLLGLGEDYIVKIINHTIIY